MSVLGVQAMSRKDSDKVFIFLISTKFNPHRSMDRAKFSKYARFHKNPSRTCGNTTLQTCHVLQGNKLVCVTSFAREKRLLRDTGESVFNFCQQSKWEYNSGNCFLTFMKNFYFFHWIIIITIFIISVYWSNSLTRFIPDWSKILELLLNYTNFFGSVSKSGRQCSWIKRSR